MIADFVKSQIAPIHAEIDRTPMALALVSGQIDRPAYGELLATMLRVHEGFESAISGIAELGELYDPTLHDRCDAIRADLEALGLQDMSGNSEWASEVIEQFDRWSTERPWALLGALYVFEGSRMGSMFIAKSLAKGFGLQLRANSGLDYHLDGIETRPQQWMQFRSRLNALSPSAEQQHDLLAGAIGTMKFMAEFYRSAPTRSSLCHA